MKSPRHIHSDAEHLVFWGQWVIIDSVHLLHQSFTRPACIVRLMGGVLAGLGLLVQVGAYGASAGTSDYLIDVWTGDSGLPNGSVTAIAQTPEGYLWVGTLNGLARFDGVRFVTYEPLNTPELKHARIAGLFLDARGTLWINTYDGSLTSWRNGRFKYEWQGWSGLQMAQVFSRSNDLVFVTLGGDFVLRRGDPDSDGEWTVFRQTKRTLGSAYREDREGALWYFTRDGLLGRVTGTNSVILPNGLGLDGQRVSAMAADRAKNIWVGTDKGIAVWDGERFQNQTPTNGEPQLNVAMLFCARDGGVWVLGNDRLRKCVERRWVAEAESWGDLLGEHMPALSVHGDRQGGVWFRHLGQGLFRAKADGVLERITSADGLPGDRITCWFQDREAGIWLGVDRGGLVHLRERKFQAVGIAGGQAAAASVCEDNQGAVWFGTLGNGLNRWQGGKLTTFAPAEDAAAKFVFSVCPDLQGRLWLSAGREDLFICEQERITRPSWDVHGVKAIFTDHQGGVWLGKSRGLSRISDGVLKDFGVNDGVEQTDFHAIAEGKGGEIWVGGGGGNLYRFSGGRFNLHKPADALANATIWSLLPDEDGVLWIGTFRGGLLRYKDGKFTRFTPAEGLPSDVICQILDDGKGNLWLGSHRGIFSVSKTRLDEFARGKTTTLDCSIYGMSDGLPTLECSGGYQPSAWRSRDDRLWFTTYRGVVSIKPFEIPTNGLPPPVVLESVSVDGKPVAAGLDAKRKDATTNSTLSETQSTQGLQIPPGKHYFEFRYTGLSFLAPDQVRFRHRLDGLEDAWIEAGTRREAHYSHLPPGKYKFLVSACNNDGVWNEAGDSLAFTVLPYFYETRWFQALMVVVAVVFVAGTARFFVVRRMRRELELLERQRAVERDRSRIAQDIHDELGAGLTQVLLQSSIASREASGQTQTDLNQISENTRDLVRKMDEIVWAVTPEKDKLDSLVTYVGKFVQEFCAAVQIRCRLDLPAQLPDIAVSTEVRHGLFLSVKEAMNNIAKHAGATEASVQLKLRPDAFTFIITDDGVGLKTGNGHDQDRLFSGRGLQNIKQRLEKIGGVCVVSAAPGRGTQVELTVWLNHKN